MGRLIAVSNRTAAGHGVRAGGLAIALWETLVESGGAWFGWSGDVVDHASRGVRVIKDEGVEFGLVDLTEEEHDGYYLGYANRALWPTFHYRVDLASFDQREFDVYASVNRRFARLIAQRAADGDLIWVHDYHLLLQGEALRQEGWRGPLGFFLHIPFPAPEIFKALPEHRRLALAMTAFDLVGFQTEKDKGNFERYLIEDCGGRRVEDWVVEVFDTRLQIGAFPIGIDASDLSRLATESEATSAADRMRPFLGDKKLVIGVDRMDYSKGLPERFEAVGRLFDVYPELRGELSFTQVAPPSRSKVSEYRELREKLDQLAGRINGDYGDLDWLPIRYLARSYPRAELSGLYRLARICLVTPLHDGMNMVAKEYIAAQAPEDPGVLILSEFAGAAEQLSEALLVNPHDVGMVADTIQRALHMSKEERIERWQALNAIVQSEDVAWWRNAFLSKLRGGVHASTATAANTDV